MKLSSELLAWSASADGYNPIQYSVYGALIRGGEIACSLAASRDDPGVPLRSRLRIDVRDAQRLVRSLLPVAGVRRPARLRRREHRRVVADA